MLLTNNKKMVE